MPKAEVLYQSSLSDLSFQVGIKSLHVPHKLHEAVTASVITLCDTYSLDTELYLIPRHLARKVKAMLLDAGINPDGFDPGIFANDILDAFDEEEEDLAADVAGEFMKVFPKTTTPEGQDLLEEGMRRAEMIPVVALEGFGLRPKMLRLARLAFFLSNQGYDAFPLPQNRVAKWLGIEQRTASAMITVLMAKGIILCSNPNWSYKDKIAKEYRFVLGQPR